MMAPTPGAGAPSLPPDGAFAARGGPSLLMTTPTPGAGAPSLPRPPFEPLLEVSNLRVAFDGKEVVRGIDFSIQPGE